MTTRAQALHIIRQFTERKAVHYPLLPHYPGINGTLSIRQGDCFARLWEPNPSHFGDPLKAFYCGITEAEFLEDKARVTLELEGAEHETLAT